MRNKKEWFVDHITQNILELIELTYHVSHDYVSDDPQLSIEYDAKRHTLVIVVNAREWTISLKQHRLNKSNTLDLFDEATRAIHSEYPIRSACALNVDIIEQTQILCLKHIDLNRESSSLESFFKFQARDGVITSMIKDRERHIWRGVVQHHGTDIDYITVVEAHHTGYPHLSDELSRQHVERYISGQLHRLSGSLDINRQIARKELTANTEVSLLNCMKWQKDNAI